MALLQQVDDHLNAVTTAVNSLFGGDANWLATPDTATLQQWMTAFYQDAQGSNVTDETIDTAERAQLLATTLPTGVTTAEASKFIDRWNRTVQYWFAEIDIAAHVPAGQSTDFLDIGVVQNTFQAANQAEIASQAAGYSSIEAEYQGSLTQARTILPKTASVPRSSSRSIRSPRSLARPSPAR